MCQRPSERTVDPVGAPHEEAESVAGKAFDQRPAGALGNLAEAGAGKQHAELGHREANLAPACIPLPLMGGNTKRKHTPPPINFIGGRIALFVRMSRDVTHFFLIFNSFFLS
jgi:hypothetical protein